MTEHEIETRKNAIAEKKQEKDEVEKEKNRVIKMRDHAQKKIKSVDEQRKKLENKKQKMKSEITQLEAEILQEVRSNESLKKQIDETVREKEWVLSREGFALEITRDVVEDARMHSPAAPQNPQ